MPFGVGGHHAVLDPVVDHLDEVARRRWGRSGGSRAQRSPPSLFPARRGGGGVDRRGERGLKIGVEVLHGRIVAADHHAVAAFEAPDAPARADVDVVHALRLSTPWRGGCRRRNKSCRRRSRCHRTPAEGRSLVEGRRRRPRPGTMSQIGAGRGRAFGRTLRARTTPTAPSPWRGRWRRASGWVSNTTQSMAPLDEPADHVGAHPPQSDHTDLHALGISFVRWKSRRDAGDSPGRGFRRLVPGLCADFLAGRRGPHARSPAVLHRHVTGSSCRPSRGAKPPSEGVGVVARSCVPFGELLELLDVPAADDHVGPPGVPSVNLARPRR